MIRSLARASPIYLSISIRSAPSVNAAAAKPARRATTERPGRGHALSTLPAGARPGICQPPQKLPSRPGACYAGTYNRGVATEYKGDVDLVTEADRASEKLIVSDSTKVSRPRHFWRRGNARRPGARYRWYVDPLDGTQISPTVFRSSVFPWGSSIGPRIGRGCRTANWLPASSTIPSR